MPLANLRFLYSSTFCIIFSILSKTCENVKKLLGTWERIMRTYIYALGCQRVNQFFR